MLGALLTVLLSGFAIGALARWAIPGPDPMPVWLTILIGLGGSIIGGGIAAAFVGSRPQTSGEYFAILLGEIVAASVLVILYRRFVQKRPITGPEAHQPPTRGFGVGRARRRGFPAPPPKNRVETLKKLDELHDQGLLTDEEYREKRAKVLRGE